MQHFVVPGVTDLEAEPVPLRLLKIAQGQEKELKLEGRTQSTYRAKSCFRAEHRSHSSGKRVKLKLLNHPWSV